MQLDFPFPKVSYLFDHKTFVKDHFHKHNEKNPWVSYNSGQNYNGDLLFLLPRDKCQSSCSALPPLLQCHQKMRHTEELNIVGTKFCCEPDTLVPQACRSLCEWEVSRQPLCMSSTKLQAQLWPLLHNSFLYIKRNSEWVRNREREYGKRAVMFQARKRMGMAASSVDWSSLSSCPCHTATPTAHTEMVSCSTQPKARKAPWKHQGEQ